MSVPRPILQAFLLADHVYKDQFTGKAIIAGVFENINAARLPTVFTGCYAYGRLIETPATFTARLRLIDLASNEEIASSDEFPVQNDKGPLAHNELIIAVPPLRFIRFGAYEFELLVNEQPLKGMRFTVSQIKEGKA